MQFVYNFDGQIYSSAKIRITPIKQIDVFDTSLYPRTYHFLSRYFSDLELLLQYALWVEHKYIYLLPFDRRKLHEKIKEKRGNARKEFVELLSNSVNAYELFIRWYKHFAPEKLEDKEWIEKTFEKYEGAPDVMFNRLYRTYVDKEWKIKPLWFTEDLEWYKTHDK